ncbi:YwqG family protein [Archangium lipolyticum]|uniref:YwqG family protein n=1 Tax=Archangium lipolyticum TaxID=2970465 RepID=UPI00214A720C|nr:YwqG family protein [Archangium lipolyticum]
MLELPPLPPSLDRWRERIESAVAPCILFTARDMEDSDIPGCRYGGHPLVPEGTAWPHSPSGPLHFVGQLDFAELAACRGEALPDLPRDGVLALFYDVQEQHWGYDPKDSAFWKLVWTPRSEEAVPLAPPAELVDAGLAFDLPLRLTPRLGMSLPDAWDRAGGMIAQDWGEAEADDYAVLRERLTGGEHTHQVGGHPWWVQNDARLEAQLVSHGLYCGDSRGYDSPQARRLMPGASEWNLLWQIGSDDQTGFTWGDYGSLYLLIRAQDLRARRFDKAWLGLQCR